MAKTLKLKSLFFFMTNLYLKLSACPNFVLKVHLFSWKSSKEFARRRPEYEIILQNSSANYEQHRPLTGRRAESLR